MGTKTTNYNWDIGTKGQLGWFPEWQSVWTSVDTELYKRSKDLYMQGKIVYGSDATGGDLILKSTSHATKGKIYFGDNVYLDQATDILMMPESVGDNSGKYILSIPTADSDNNNYTFGFFRSINPNGTRRNDVFAIGYNLPVYGLGQSDINDASAGIFFESHYQPSAGVQSIELYAEIHKEITGTGIRPWASYHNKVTGELNNVFNANLYEFMDETGTHDWMLLTSAGLVIDIPHLPTVHIKGPDGSYMLLLSGVTNGFRMGAANGYSNLDAVDDTGTGSFEPLYIGSSTLYLNISGTPKLTIAADGSVNLAEVLKIDNVQVVSNRVTGWAAATGTKSKATFVTDSVTLPNLAARVGQVIDDLILHGLIGA